MMNIFQLCEEIDDDEARSKSLGIQMYLAVNPMLSERLNVKDVAKQLSANKTYQIEDKFDGERFQVRLPIQMSCFNNFRP